MELRLSVARVFLLVPAELGLLGLGDAGRVFLSGETSDRWHGAVGGGLWIAFLNRGSLIDVFFVECREDHGPVIFHSGVAGFKLRQHVVNCRACRQIQPQLTRADDVFQ